MDTPERGILHDVGKDQSRDEEANLGSVKEQDGAQSGDSSGRDGEAMQMAAQQATSHTT